MLYSLLRPLLFSLDPETTHRITLSAIKYAHQFKLLHDQSIDCKHRKIMGLDFPNPIGLAAGLDKNGEYIKALATFGFGFIEIGTVTPRPQPGNLKPRLFRITQANAIINRLGFNNHGVDVVVQNIKNANYQGILGINIGKNFDTPVEKACDDYLECLRKVYYCASYIVINISSPNTPNLRKLQNTEEFDHLLNTLKSEQTKLADDYGKYTPLVVKIAPDLESIQITSIAMLLIKHKIDGVIATNSTLSRDKIEHLPHSNETGGLSGAPLTKLATNVICQLHDVLQDAVPVIGVGGIMCATDVQKKMDAGASLVQIYTGLIYRGPELVREAVKAACK
jgi:dihydroorotate dehydrogenase